MTFLFDENFPVSATTVIEAAGHKAIGFADACRSGDDDETVFMVAQRLGAVILTSDRDFYHTLPFLHPMHHGIVVLSLRQPSRQSVCERLAWFLANVPPPFDNKVFALRDRTYCTRGSSN